MKEEIKIGGPDSLFDGHPKDLNEAVNMYLLKSSDAEGFHEAATSKESDFVTFQHHFSNFFFEISIM